MPYIKREGTSLVSVLETDFFLGHWSANFNMAFQNVTVVSAPNSSAISADQARRNFQSYKHPILAWYCVAGFILFLPFCRVIAFSCRLRRRPSPSGMVPRTRGVINYWRLPAAIIHTFNTIAFRWTFSFQLGKFYAFRVSVAQCFITAAYMAILLTWSFIDCMSQGSRITSPVTVLFC